jgi:hypothetical protein
MPLPNRPELNEPIPNSDIPENSGEFTVKGPYWDMPVGENLEVSASGELSATVGI